MLCSFHVSSRYTPLVNNVVIIVMVFSSYRFWKYWILENDWLCFNLATFYIKIDGYCCSSHYRKIILPVKERKFTWGTGLYHTQYQFTLKYGWGEGTIFSLIFSSTENYKKPPGSGIEKIEAFQNRPGTLGKLDPTVEIRKSIW